MRDKSEVKNNDALISGMIKISNNPSMDIVSSVSDWKTTGAVNASMVDISDLTTEEIVACFGKSFPYRGNRYKMGEMISVKGGQLIAFIVPDEFSLCVKAELRSCDDRMFSVSRIA